MKKYALYLIIFMSSAAVVSKAETMRIGTQAEFDALNARIADAVAAGSTDISIEFEPRTYYFKDGHISIANCQWQRVSIAIHGHGATLTARGRDLAAGQAYGYAFDRNSGYITPAHGDVPMWGDLHEADGLIEVDNETQKLCHLPYADIDDMSEVQCRNIYICVTQWFKSNVYKVLRIKDGDIYFTASDLSYNQSRRCYSVNTDYGYGESLPRFRLCNSPLDRDRLVSIGAGRISLPADVDSVHECNATTFLRISASRMASLRADGIRFLGNMDGANALIQIEKTSMDSCAFTGCTFSGIRSNVFSAVSSPRLSITQCAFSQCYRYGIYAVACDGASITHNTFNQMNLALTNTFCIRVSGSDLDVSHNEIRDFGYGGISAGTWWGAPANAKTTGYIHHNHLCYTPLYMQAWKAHSLMDSGAIYLLTQNDDIHICYNFIHDYNGACDNRGIFCDDGAYNFQIYGNLIINTPNSYSIDARRSLGIERNPNTYAHTVNVNNRIYDNVIDGSIRFEGRNRNANCSLGVNFFLSPDGRLRQQNSLQFLSVERPFVSARFDGIRDGKVQLPNAAMRRLSALRSSRELMPWIEVR